MVAIRMMALPLVVAALALNLLASGCTSRQNDDNAREVTASRADTQDRAQQQTVWLAHLRRKAWNKAHPAEAAHRRAEERARLVEAEREAVAAREAAARTYYLAREADANTYYLTDKQNTDGTNGHDSYYSLDDVCPALEEAAERVVTSIQDGTSLDSSPIPGVHFLAAGTRVTLKGHESVTCSNVALDFSQVLVADGGSSDDGKTEYLLEGGLTKR